MHGALRLSFLTRLQSASAYYNRVITGELCFRADEADLYQSEAVQPHVECPLGLGIVGT